MELDTGAAVSVISEQQWNQLFLNVATARNLYRKSTTRLFKAAGTSKRTKGNASTIWGTATKTTNSGDQGAQKTTIIWT